MHFRLRDFAYPLRIARLRRFLAASESWSEVETKTWQIAALRQLLVHAHATCPFWRRRLDQARVDVANFGDLSTLHALPILTKEEVRSHLDDLQSDRASEFAPRWSETSGSTGTALRFALDRPTNVLEFATLWRQFNWAGYRFGDRFADLRGHLVVAADGIERDVRLNALNLSSFQLAPERVRDYAAALVRFRPVMVRGYPSSIALFSAWSLEQGLELPVPRAVVTSSETLLEHQRAVIVRAFRCPVFDYYGQMERVAFAGQCQAGRYHVATEYGIVELLDGEGREVEGDQPGRIVATGLHHRAMPFIRYETRDLAIRAVGPCRCGRTSPTLERIIGRREDIIVTPDRRHVGRLDAAFKHSPGIQRARIVQQVVERIRVEIVPSSSYGESDQHRLLAELRLRLGDAIAIDIVTVPDLPLDRSGKLKFVVSSIGREVEGRALSVSTADHPEPG